jgi:hypothetical protein
MSLKIQNQNLLRKLANLDFEKKEMEKLLNLE